jgi:hypothetical protein
VRENQDLRTGEVDDIRGTVTRLFEAARKKSGAPYEPERFLAYLTSPPVKSGRQVADTFAGRRRFVRFMHAVELELAICFTLDEWGRGFGLDEFAQLVAARRRKSGALRLAQNRLREARHELLRVPLVCGILTSPLLVGAVKIDHPARILLGLPWIVITGAVTVLAAEEYRFARQLVARIATSSSQKEGRDT